MGLLAFLYIASGMADLAVGDRQIKRVVRSIPVSEKSLHRVYQSFNFDNGVEESSKLN